MNSLKHPLSRASGSYSSPVWQAGKDSAWQFDANATYSEITFSDAWKQHRGPEYHAYREAWHAVPAAKADAEFPLHLDIETTTRCNLKCPMCPRTLLVEKGAFNDYGFLTRKEYASIIDQGREHGVKSIKLNYLGEPLLHKDVFWQVEYAKQAGVIDVLMNTNGTALTAANGEKLLRAGIDGVFISFDAVNPADYERQRVGSTLGRVIDNLYAFVKLRNAIRPGCQVRVSMVMYDDPKWREQFAALQVMWRGLVDGVGYSYYVERDHEVAGEYPEVEGFHCAQPFHRMFLKNNGNVTICCFDDKDEVIVGNWREQKLYDIWHGEAYRGIRRLHAEGRYYEMEMCRKCYFPCSQKQADVKRAG
ncbi:MAG TPA: radical SAM protein [Alphaproteobacteria bacterium]|nr:radical SAM protein [Alphaproteobacteria bacterium]